MERYVLDVVGREAMTFKQILDIAFPEGTFDGDMARILGASNVSRPRSLRRALFRLCEKGVLKKIGIKTPYSYQLMPFFHEAEFNPPLIGLFYQCAAEDRTERHASIGAMLLEARPQFASDDDFRDWLQREFGMTLRQANERMDAARRKKDNPPAA